MTWTRATIFHSIVQYFCIFACVSVLLLHGEYALGAKRCTDADRKIWQEKCLQSEKTRSENRENCRALDYDCGSDSNSKPDPCQSAYEEERSTLRDVNRNCGDAGLGSTCASTLAACDKVAGDEDFISDNDFFKALGQQFGISNGASKCPKYSGQGFFERKDKYERSLDDINDKLGDLKEKTADLEKDFNENVQEIQKDLQEAQDDLKKKQLEINKEQRERAAESAKTTSEVAATIRKKLSEILQMRTQINETYRSKNSNLIAMTENAAKRACMKKVRELKKEYADIKAGSLSAGFAAATKKKKELNDTFNECMSQFDTQRAALIAQSQEKVEAIEMQIANNQSDIDNAEQQLASMIAQEQQAKADETTAMANATNTVQEKITRGQTKLTSLAKTTQEKANALKEKEKYYQNKSKQVSNSLASLGPVPADETSTTKLSQVQGSFDTYSEAVERRLALCPDSKPPALYERVKGGSPSPKSKDKAKK